MVAADDATDEQKDQADYICDAVADNVELQAALDAVPATGGTVILFGQQFNLEAGSADALTISNAHTVLESPTFATIAAGVAYGKFLIYIAANYVKLHNLKVDQTDAGSAIGFDTDIINPVIDRCELATPTQYAVSTKTGCIDAVISNCYCDRSVRSYDNTNENWRVLNCNIAASTAITSKGDKGVLMNNTFGGTATVYGDYNTIEGNTGSRLSLNGNYNTAIGNVLIDAAPYDGLYLQGNHNNAIGNYVDGAGNGINVKSGDQCTLIGNTCVNSIKHESASNGYGILIYTHADNTRLIGNYCAGNEIANIIAGSTVTPPVNAELIGNIVSSGPEYGICIMDGSSYTLIQGNLVYGNGQPGIWLENVAHCVIKGNMVYNNQVAAHGEGGITLHSGVDYCFIEGNKCFDTQNPKTQKYGIDIYNANCDDNVILGNDVRANLTAGIHDAGTGTIIRNNLGYNPVGISSISVGESPFTHTAGASPETVYVSGGTVTSITKGGNNFGLTSGAFELEPYESIVVTYSVAPTMFRDVH